MRPQRAFTIVELLVTIALVAITLALVAPSFQNLILVSRLKGINQQLVTDLQLARTEAVGRNTLLRLAFFDNSGMTCYTLYTVPPTSSARCDCRLGVGAACSTAGAGATEVRTVQVERSLSVQVVPAEGIDPAFAYDPVTGGIKSIPSDDFIGPLAAFTIFTKLDDSRWLRTTVAPTGRPSVCGSVASLGAPAC